jgi:MFS family permease
MIRSLRHRNFRLFFFGQGVSLIGTWMQGVAVGWLVYRLTGSAWDLGTVGFAGQILTFVVAPVAGVLADRWNRHRLVLCAQVLATLQALALAVLTLGGIIEVWHIILLALAGGLIRGFEIPTRQSFVVEMLDDRRDLPNAIALNSFLVNGSRLIGPLLAGALIYWTGEGICFLLNALSYLAVIWALLAMRLKPYAPHPPRNNMLDGLKEGFLYAARSASIRPVLLLLCIVSLAGVPYAVLMPMFAVKVLGGDATTNGILLGAVGVGAILGAIFLASRRTVVGLGRIIGLAAGAFGAGLAAFSFSDHLWLSLPLLAWVGCAMMMQMASSNTVLQTVVDEDKRGRVMSFYTMAFMGMGPFGSLLAGSLAERCGAPVTVLAGGIACVAAALLFAASLRRLDKTVAASGPWPGVMADLSAEEPASPLPPPPHNGHS